MPTAKKWSRYWLVGVFAAGLAAALAWAFRPPRLAVDVAPAARGPLVVTVDEEGRTRIKERYVVSAPLAGRLLRVALKAGDPVAAGRTVVAVLEPGDPELLDPRARAQAEARVNAARAVQEQAGPLRERAHVAFEYARVGLERARQLYAGQGLSHEELDAAEQREAVAAADLRSAEFQERIANYEFELARAALLGEPDEANVAATGRRFEVRAPIDGRVLRIFQESATVVAAGTRLVELGDPADLEIEVEVLSSEAVKIAPGARVMIEHWGGDVPLAARVRVVEPAGFTKVSALGVEEQRVIVRADFTGPAETRRSLGDAYRVEARIVVWEGADVLKLPVGALFREGEQWAVFAVERGRAALRRVEVGRRNNREAEITAGLAGGETVVVHPSDKLQAGVRVAPR
ncbi:MAG: HlyD family efflux transporter periplasmic adaptor subunit [Opitutaceae bacterium]|nr:HlyD family efflux transporter periplasmic adaptor subunit [Opitutaceae bacterium]